MMRCFLDPADWREPESRLSPEETRHATRVLRKKPGDWIELFDGLGRCARARIEGVEGKTARVSLSEVRQEPPVGSPRTLAQALVKGDKSDWIVQKAVELGVTRLAWFGAERSVVQVNEARAPRRMARWRTVAIQAAKQCGRNRIPEISLFPSVSAWCRTREEGQAWLLCSLHPESKPARDVFTAMRPFPEAGVSVAVGPEGDFTPREEDEILNAGAQRISLGPHVLRVETAALFVLSILAYESTSNGAVFPPADFEPDGNEHAVGCHGHHHGPPDSFDPHRTAGPEDGERHLEPPEADDGGNHRP